MATGISDGSCDEFPALVGMLGQHLAHPAEQPAGGLDPGAGDDGKEDQQLALAQVAGGAGLVLELHAQQFGDQVVGGVLLPPGDIVGEHVAVEVVVLA